MDATTFSPSAAASGSLTRKTGPRSSNRAFSRRGPKTPAISRIVLLTPRPGDGVGSPRAWSFSAQNAKSLLRRPQIDNVSRAVMRKVVYRLVFQRLYS